ncbi:hypothetical protein [Dokdonella soli]|uniref:Peptidase M61 catalytic domain-containing protein n=1 Tax=Dokdonella soli TaxID=529810 RepID=A0ABP3TNN8_9GAMM
MPLRPLALFAAFMLAATAQGAGSPHYQLRYEAGTATMQVTLCLAQAVADVHLEAGDDAARHLDGLARDSGAPLQRTDRAWNAHDWRAGECLHYHVPLGRIADDRSRHDQTRRGDDLVIDPSSWLLQVGDADAADLRVELPPGFSISVPWQRLPSSDGASHYRIPRTPDDWMARIAIGRFREQDIALAGGTLHVAIFKGADAAQRERLIAWLRRISRDALSAYGRLPLTDVQVLVVPIGPQPDVTQREAVVFGQSTRGQGNALTLFVDPTQNDDAFDRDWVAVHELSHLLHPYLGDRGAWLSEGLATYYQNVLRARAGLLTPEQAWAQLDDGFARGRRDTRPDLDLEQASLQMGERHDFQRVYWSGTAYWLQVDAELRRASANRMSVDEALRRFDACCLPSYRRWAPDEFVAKLDALAGSAVFTQRFREFRARHDFPELTALYAALGLGREGETLRVDDQAPAANVRRAVMQGPALAKRPSSERVP